MRCDANLMVLWPVGITIPRDAGLIPSRKSWKGVELPGWRGESERKGNSLAIAPSIASCSAWVSSDDGAASRNWTHLRTDFVRRPSWLNLYLYGALIGETCAAFRMISAAFFALAADEISTGGLPSVEIGRAPSGAAWISLRGSCGDQKKRVKKKRSAHRDAKEESRLEKRLNVIMF
jgi:hypothetical protein